MAQSVVNMLEGSTNVTRSWLTPELASKWSNIVPLLLEYNVVKTETIKTLDAEKYRFDMYGLFKHVLNVDDIYIYPHILVNGYDSSYDYNGNQLIIKLLDTGVLQSYYRLFIKK